MSKKRQYVFWSIHVVIWITVAIFFAIPSYDWTVGVFHSGDGSIVVPMIYGAIINAFIFYGNTHYLLVTFLAKGNKAKYWFFFVILFVGLSVLESVLDAGWFIYYFGDINAEVYEEIFTSNFFLNCVFFALPSFFYRFTLDWSNNTTSQDNVPAPISTAEKDINKSDEILMIKSGRSTYKVHMKDIEFVESSGNNVIYHYGGEQLTVRDSLSKLAESLPPHLFVRCHKSFIISKLHVNKADYDFIYLSSTQIPIGRVYRENVSQLYR